MDDLTGRQEEILRFCAGFRRGHGAMPSVTDLAEAFDLHYTTIRQHLKAIARKNYFSVSQSGQGRTIRIALTEKAERYLNAGYLLYGSVPAGPTFEADELEAESVRSIEDVVPGMREGDFLLVVDGDSMIEAGLEPGMLVVMRPQLEPRPGDICAVWIAGEGSTLKRVYPEGEQIRLVPENADYEERAHAAEHVHVGGVLVASIGVRAFRTG